MSSQYIVVSLKNLGKKLHVYIYLSEYVTTTCYLWGKNAKMSQWSNIKPTVLISSQNSEGLFSHRYKSDKKKFSRVL